MIDASQCSAVVPTRGDVDVRPIVESLELAGISDIVVWDNSRRDDRGIYGRYAAIQEARHDVVVTQDDDLLVHDWAAILAAYAPGVLTLSYPEPWDIPWVARGAVFDRRLVDEAFAWYDQTFERDRLFTHAICDAVFALLTDRVNVIDVGSTDLPHGLAAGRVSTSPGWYHEKRPEAQRRCVEVKKTDRPVPVLFDQPPAPAPPPTRWRSVLARLAA